jgi:hypothetical protein
VTIMTKKKELDLDAISTREEWDAYGRELCSEPTRTWLNLGAWLNAGEQFFKGKDSEILLLGNARSLVTTLDERSLRRYKETEKATRDARKKMADNGCPLTKEFVYFYHVRGLHPDDQVLFLTTDRPWKNHRIFAKTVEGFIEKIKDVPDIDLREAVLEEVYAAVEKELADQPKKPKPDRNSKKITAILRSDIFAVLEFLAKKEEQTVEQYLADLAYNEAKDHATEYVDFVKEETKKARAEARAKGLGYEAAVDREKNDPEAHTYPEYNEEQERAIHSYSEPSAPPEEKRA